MFATFALEAIPRHETAHAALLADILDFHTRLVHAAQGAISVAAGGATQPERAQSAVIPAGQSLPARDRQRAVRLGQHREHPIRNIYAKFQAQDHSSAVPRVRELRLLLAAAAS